MERFEYEKNETAFALSLFGSAFFLVGIMVVALAFPPPVLGVAIHEGVGVRGEPYCYVRLVAGEALVPCDEAPPEEVERIRLMTSVPTPSQAAYR